MKGVKIVYSVGSVETPILITSLLNCFLTFFRTKKKQINKVDKIQTELISTDTPEGLNIAVHMFVLRMIRKHNPSKSGVWK